MVELEVICDCECASDQNRSQSPVECNEHGDLECGICRCYPGRFGANCQCDWNESKGEDPSLCVKPDGKNETCSGELISLFKYYRSMLIKFQVKDGVNAASVNVKNVPIRTK